MSKKKAPAKIPLTIRLSLPAYRWLLRAAKSSQRTLSGQLEYLLLRWVQLAGPAPKP